MSGSRKSSTRVILSFVADNPLCAAVDYLARLAGGSRSDWLRGVVEAQAIKAMGDTYRGSKSSKGLSMPPNIARHL